jgi:hypothetical protein
MLTLSQPAVMDSKSDVKCTANCGRPQQVLMTGYAEDSRELRLCRDCALQLARKLLEDLCELVAGDRHG